MADELLVAGNVRAVAARLRPGDDLTTERAVAAAVQAHLAGASTSEACRRGRQLLESQARHPSCQRPLRALSVCEGRPAPPRGSWPLLAGGGATAGPGS